MAATGDANPLSDEQLDRLGVWFGTELARSEGHHRESQQLYSLVRALKQHPPGMKRRIVLDHCLRIWRNEGWEIPRTFDDSIQQALERHCKDSEVFKKRIASGECSEDDALFYWPDGAGAGRWAMYADRAFDWLVKLNRIAL